MSETTLSPQAVQPLVVNIQYVKDLSFEVPGAPQIYSQLRAQPQVSINLDVQARRVQEGQSVFEVAIMIRAEAHDTSAQTNGQAANPAPTVFVAELTYAGVFTLNGLRTTRSSRCCWSNARASCSRSRATSCPM